MSAAAAAITETTVGDASGMDNAVVLAVEGAGHAVLCRVGERTVRATIAVPGAYSPRVGDSVLVAPSRSGAHYVLGVLTALREVAPALTTPDGATVSTERGAHGDVVRVHDTAGRALFEYRTGDGRCTVFAPAGDLELRADHGSIDLVAAQRVGVKATEFALEGTRARAKVTDAEIEARELTTVVDRVRQTLGAIETRATEVFEWARVVFREATELAESRARKLRMVAEDDVQIHGRRAVLKVDEDMKLKAEQIHLA